MAAGDGQWQRILRRLASRTPAPCRCSQVSRAAGKSQARTLAQLASRYPNPVAVCKPPMLLASQRPRPAAACRPPVRTRLLLLASRRPHPSKPKRKAEVRCHRSDAKAQVTRLQLVQVGRPPAPPAATRLVCTCTNHTACGQNLHTQIATLT